MEDLKKRIEELMNLVEEEIQLSFTQIEPRNLYEPIKYLIEAKGKRLRPVLTMIATGLVGGKIENALKPAVAFELLHNFTLIHDDIMDKSPTRRGRETIHIKWGDAIGILSGDLLLAHAYKKLIDSLPKEIHQDVIRTFNESFIEVCEGQGYDIHFECRSEINEEDYFQMIDKKTAKLIEKALVAGGQIGSANEEQILSLSEIGRNLGLAFQLQDDLLDLTATSEKFGKEIGKDIKEGKKTLIMIKAKELFMKHSDILLLDKFYSNNGLTGEDVHLMIDALKRNNIFELIKTKINEFFDNIQKDLNCFENNEYKRMLMYVIDIILNRDY